MTLLGKEYASRMISLRRSLITSTMESGCGQTSVKTPPTRFLHHSLRRCYHHSKSQIYNYNQGNDAIGLEYSVVLGNKRESLDQSLKNHNWIKLKILGPLILHGEELTISEEVVPWNDSGLPAKLEPTYFEISEKGISTLLAVVVW